MDLQFVRSHWRSHLPPLVAGAVAVFVLIISPFWTYQWIQVPFLGVSLEQNNVVSQVNGTNWPARMQGVAFKERLVALNGEAVPDIRDMQRMVADRVQTEAHQHITVKGREQIVQVYSIKDIQ